MSMHPHPSLFGSLCARLAHVLELTHMHAAPSSVPRVHQVHLHLVQFHIDDASSLENGWKDIVMVPNGGTRSVTMTFNGNPGLLGALKTSLEVENRRSHFLSPTFPSYIQGVYVFHCHNLGEI